MNLEQAISQALGIEVRFSHNITGRTTISIPEVLYTGENWHQRNLRDAWHLPKYNRLRFSNEPEALSFFLRWYMDVMLGIQRDDTGMVRYMGPMPLTSRDEYLDTQKGGIDDGQNDARRANLADSDWNADNSVEIRHYPAKNT